MPPCLSTKITLAAVATLAITGLTGCGGGSDSGGATGEGGSGQTVVIKDFKFAPANLRVAPGSKVSVKNEDNTAHTLTAADGSFDTGNIEPKGQKEVTVSKAGQISYRCDIHQYMSGVIQAGGS